ncbi:MAG: pyridoxamine 5'-phosphate oxidase [Pseudomonadota bacterium]
MNVAAVRAAGPLALAGQWLERATERAATPNPNAMVVSTLGPGGRPSGRVVLCKTLDTDAGFAVFYTNYESRKGRELDANPACSAVFHWDSAERQLRLEGLVERATPNSSDRYFASRPWRSRIGAWASQQSQPIASREALDDAARRTAERFGTPDPFGDEDCPDDLAIARPPHWGGYRLWIASLEFWQGGACRIHDRVLCERDLNRSGATGWETGEFRIQRLQP